MSTTTALGLVALGIYAVLLGGGGVMGYLKAGSRPSLIAGLATAAVALVALIVGAAVEPSTGFILGLLVAAAMTVFFFSRWRKSNKFMPSGMLAVLSAVMTSLMACLLIF